MPKILLPDGSHRTYPDAVSVLDVAADIGAGLAKATLAGIVDGQLVDASHPIDVDLLRHSTAHLMAQAVKQLFPSAKVSIGPVVEGGFYYDFDYERSFTPEDLETIEARMKELVSQNIPISRSEISRDGAHDKPL